MKATYNMPRGKTIRKNKRVRTSIMELVGELSKLTKDDNLVVAAVRQIFGACNVRLAGAAVPVRLVNSDIPDRAYMTRVPRRKSVR